MGYINPKASFVIEPKFDIAMPFSERVARVSVEGRWGFIDRNGEFVIDPKFAIVIELGWQVPLWKEGWVRLCGQEWGVRDRSRLHVSGVLL